MKALIIGASGLVGSHLMQAATNRKWNVTGTYSAHPQEGLIPLDISDHASISGVLNTEAPDVIFLTAFNPNIDYCETHPEETSKINIDGNKKVIDVASKLGILIVYYSTDLVFDGKKGPYPEHEIPSPMCVYGRQKLTVENYLSAQAPRALIVRTTTVYGWEKQGKNYFCNVLHSLSDGHTMSVSADQIITPTLASDLAEVSCDLVEKNASGIVHVAGPDRMSRYDFALHIAKAFGLREELLQPAPSNELHQSVHRPLHVGLISERLPQLIQRTMHGVLQGLTSLKESCADWKTQYYPNWKK